MHSSTEQPSRNQIRNVPINRKGTKSAKKETKQSSPFALFVSLRFKNTHQKFAQPAKTSSHSSTDEHGFGILTTEAQRTQSSGTATELLSRDFADDMDKKDSSIP